uniref:Uncharacterized protein n=1 Tax=Nymphaea colorata TaxID=210225 RepID=A0A5K1FFD3_9MAGN
MGREISERKKSI